MNRGLFSLRVLETRDEADRAAKTVMFDVPEPLAETFAWWAGQHLSLRLDLDGNEERHSHFISASPFSGEPLRITVKQVKGGLVSNHINDNVKPGDLLDAMPPFGGFYLDPGEMKRRTHHFFSAGSGVTPLYAMIHSVLCAEPYSVCHLTLGNRDEKGIVFRQALEGHAAEHPDRLSLHHFLSDQSMWSGFRPWCTGPHRQ